MNAAAQKALRLALKQAYPKLKVTTTPGKGGPRLMLTDAVGVQLHDTSNLTQVFQLVDGAGLHKQQQEDLEAVMADIAATFAERGEDPNAAH